MQSDDDETPPPPRRRARAPWLSGASTLLAIAALLAVWAVIATHG